VIRVLSPKAYALYQEMAFDSAFTSSWHTLSLYPYATRLEILRLFALALLFWVVANHLRTREQVVRVVRLIMAVGFLLAIFGIIQHFTWNGRLYWVRELTKGGNPFGPYVNRNHFSGYMEMVIPLSLGFLFAKERDHYTGVSGWRDRLLRWGTPEASRLLLIFFGGLIMVAALLFTGSRAGLFSFLSSMLFMALLLLIRRFRSRRWWRLIALFVVLGFAYALWLKPEKVLQTFAILWLGTADPSAQGRLLVWEDTLRLGRAFLWSGTGLNTFSWAFPLYKRPLSGQVLYTHTENDYLQAFAEGGLPLVTFLALALLWGGAQLQNRWSESERPFERGLGLGLLGGIAALLIHSAGDFNLHIMANAMLFVLLLGLATRVLIIGCSRA
jgi:O-antigen ligase